MNLTFWRHAALSCVQKGGISYLPATAEYIKVLEYRIGSGANSEQINTYSQKVNVERPANSITIQECRTVDMMAVQNQQEKMERRRQEMERQRQLESFSQSMDDMAATARSMNERSSSSTVYCQHYEWGNTTFCN